MPTKTDAAVLRAAVERKSLTATILTVVTSLVGLAVGLGVIDAAQQGIVIAATTAAVTLGGLVAAAIHTGKIEPSALVAAVGALVAQIVALAVSFAWISDVTAGTVVAITTAVLLCVAQVAHAVVSRQVA